MAEVRLVGWPALAGHDRDWPGKMWSVLSDFEEPAHVWHRRDHRAIGWAQPRRLAADERCHASSWPGRRRKVGFDAGRPRLGHATGAPPALDPRPLARRCPTDGGPGHWTRFDLQRR